MADIVHRIGIRAPAQRVYDALATAQGVAGWWSRNTTGTAAVGGTLTSRFLDPSGMEIGHMTYEMTTLEPSREVCWRFDDGPPEWIGTEVTFQLSEDGDMTIVVFAHRNWKEPVEFMAHCSMKWATFLMSLRGLAETGQGRPSPEDMKIDNWN